MPTVLQNALSTANGLQGLAANKQNQEIQSREMDLRELGFQHKTAEHKRQIALSDESKGLLQQFQESIEAGNPDYNLVAQAYLKSPELSQQYLETIGVIDEIKGKQAAGFVFTGHQMLEQGDVEGAIEVATQRLQGLKQGGRQFEETAELLQDLKDGNIDKAKAGFKLMAGALTNGGMMDKEIFKRIDPTNAVHFQKGVDGLVFNPKTGENKIDPTFIENKKNLSQLEIDTQNTIDSNKADKTRRTSAINLAVKKAGVAFDKIEAIDKEMLTIDKAIAAIDEGAQSGTIASRFPSIRSSSIKLDNTQKQLGLNVISNTTFGALSEEELKIALSTAMPKNLKPAELKQWLVDKKNAQQKLRDYVNQAAIFLGSGEKTVSDWLELQRSNADEERNNLKNEKFTESDRKELEALRAELGVNQ